MTDFEKPQTFELTDISLHTTEAPSNDETLPLETEKITVNTDHGPIHVTVQGDRKNPLIITYHDVGFDHQSCFQNFMSYPPSRALAEVMCIAHIDAPGMQRDAPSLPAEYVYPTLDQLADQVEKVRLELGHKMIVGFGAGFGGNILLRYAEKNQSKVYGLILLGVNPYRAGWVEWGYYKMASYYLSTNKTMTKFTEDAILNNVFSPATIEGRYDLVEQFRDHLQHHVNPANLAKFLTAYISRPDYSVELNKEFRPRVLLVAGHDSPYTAEVESLNAKLNPERTSYLKIFNTGNMVQEEYPHKVLEATLLFLQGLGMAVGATLRLNKLSQRRENPEDIGLRPVQ